MSLWRKWGHGWVELLFPLHCPFCGTACERSGRVVCPACLSGIRYLQSPLCSCCGREFPDSSGTDHLCATCLRQPPVFAQARAVVRYEDPVSHLLHRLKYATDTTTLPMLTQVLEPFVRVLGRDFHPETDCVIPVPLFPSRLKKRGLNQSLLLARIFFPAAGDALLMDALLRSRDTVPQTTLDGAARRRNLRAAFTVRHPEKVRGRRVFLVDDVLTMSIGFITYLFKYGRNCSRFTSRRFACYFGGLCYCCPLPIPRPTGTPVIDK